MSASPFYNRCACGRRLLTFIERRREQCSVCEKQEREAYLSKLFRALVDVTQNPACSKSMGGAK